MAASRVTVAMLGARMNYAVPRILYKSGQLRALITDVYLAEGQIRRIIGALEKLPVNASFLKSLLGRYHSELDGAVILDRNRGGMRNILKRRRSTDRTNRRAAKQSGSRLLAELFETELPDAGDAVFAFHQAALESFEIAKARGMKRILEQSIAASPFSQKLLIKESAAWGDWYNQASVPKPGSAATERSMAEWDAADTILAGSDFVRESLVNSGVPERKIVVVPYGVSLPLQGHRLPDYQNRRPLRLLFAGNVQLRKGIHYLLQAVDRLGPNAVELCVAGDVGLRPEIVQRYAHVARFHGRVPRQDMQDLYRWADVFVLPSLIEGSATVIYEALSHGLPAIVTPNVGSVVDEGVEGQVVSAGSVDVLVGAIERYITDSGLLEAHAAGARSARDKVSFSRYEQDLHRFFQEHAAKA